MNALNEYPWTIYVALLATMLAIVFTVAYLVKQRRESRRRNIERGKAFLESVRSFQPDHLRHGEYIQSYVDIGEYTYEDIGTTEDEFDRLWERARIRSQIWSSIQTLRDPVRTASVDPEPRIVGLLDEGGFTLDQFGTSRDEIRRLVKECRARDLTSLWAEILDHHVRLRGDFVTFTRRMSRDMITLEEAHVDRARFEAFERGLAEMERRDATPASPA